MRITKYKYRPIEFLIFFVGYFINVALALGIFYTIASVIRFHCFEMGGDGYYTSEYFSTWENRMHKTSIPVTQTILIVMACLIGLNLIPLLIKKLKKSSPAAQKVNQDIPETKENDQ